jgi:hypothetical protein
MAIWHLSFAPKCTIMRGNDRFPKLSSIKTYRIAAIIAKKALKFNEVRCNMKRNSVKWDILALFENFLGLRSAENDDGEDR